MLFQQDGNLRSLSATKLHTLAAGALAAATAHLLQIVLATIPVAEYLTECTFPIQIMVRTLTSSFKFIPHPPYTLLVGSTYDSSSQCRPLLLLILSDQQ